MFAQPIQMCTCLTPLDLALPQPAAHHDIVGTTLLAKPGDFDM
jgi:hypothetical protein